MKHVCNSGGSDGLAGVGALVQLILLPHRSVRDTFIAAGNLPQTVATFMVDTGADRTIVEQRIAEAMGLAPLRFTPMVGVSGEPVMSPVYLMSLRIGVSGQHGDGTIDFDAEIIGMPQPKISRPYVGLLGRDFLRGIHVIYNGPKGIVELILSSEITGKKPAIKVNKKKKARH